MTKLLLYLLESSVLLATFYLFYQLVLSRETFFNLNRFFLLGTAVFSLLFPLVSFDFTMAESPAVVQPVERISNFRMSYYEAVAAWEYEAANSGGATIAVNGGVKSEAIPGKVILEMVLWIYATGVLVCLSRLMWGLFRLSRLVRRHPHDKRAGLTIVRLPVPTAPFSFFSYVFVHEETAASAEFSQILDHEKLHVRQRHSADLLFVQLLAAIFWFNPVVWRLIKSLKETHEYIADRKIINMGHSLVEYQALLLKQLISNNSVGLVHNFNLSFIKRRITMMTNQRSGWAGKVKVAFTIVLAIALSAIIVQCNSRPDEPAAPDSAIGAANDFAAGVDLPVLPGNGFVYEANPAGAVDVTVGGNEVSVAGETVEVAEIASALEKAGLPEEGVIVFRADKDQSMGLIRAVQTELRKANRRKLLYLGRTATGQVVESALLLPPMPGDKRPGVAQMPEIDAEYIARTGIEVLVLRLGSDDGVKFQEKVDQLLRKHIEMGSSNYVVSAGFNDKDTYQSYLVNLCYIQEGFNQIYQERSQQMFGKDFVDIVDNKEQYLAVRQGIPRAISIAEN